MHSGACRHSNTCRVGFGQPSVYVDWLIVLQCQAQSLEILVYELLFKPYYLQADVKKSCSFGVFFNCCECIILYHKNVFKKFSLFY